jgi:hypothetical protein
MMAVKRRLVEVGKWEPFVKFAVKMYAKEQAKNNKPVTMWIIVPFTDWLIDEIRFCDLVGEFLEDEIRFCDLVGEFLEREKC